MPKYSLWLMPPAPVRDRFAAIIRRLSERLGTPVFEPHVTLTGTETEDETDAVRRVEQLAQALAPIPIALIESGYSDAYFRCLYLRAANSPALLAAYRRACDALGAAPTDFMPHLSLVYGDLNAADKQRLIAELGRDWDVQFTAQQLALYIPEGRPEQWRRVADFALRGDVGGAGMTAR